ncbi:diaminopimelate decarboxylase [Prosthecomicrobium hirschii]|uniref:diaminopimelate decarboxylase n=1 Tax=Prosthecodimorpha hirschii TaxID=665126 RepID=UPI00112BCF93|nr:diaminopimelate decarboxylase [Prosthecomicrobium hirschii]TPQ52582.1 diaminopimelate decarboxylase [Prosthecomicrobium hirschii]
MPDATRRLPASAFAYRDGELCVEGVALARIAEAVGTPFYCYSAGRLRERARALKAALGPLGVDIHFAMKANGNQAVLALFAAEGIGADIVSGGELARALAAGIPPGHVVFSGVGKTAGEIDAALAAGIHQINVESFEELHLVETLAAARGIVAEVALRINPDVDAETHAKITTGKKDNKFGIDVDRLARLDNELKALAHVRVVGLAIHIGSQIMSAGPFLAAYRTLLAAADTLKARGVPLTRLDLGGGFGIPYENELEFSFADLAGAIRETVAGKGYALAVEPGRSLVADAGVLVSRVAFVKDAGHMQFAVLDAAMNDLVRPAMYEAHHDIVPVRAPAAGAVPVEYDVVGPICESSDTFARRLKLAPLAAGDLVVLATAGAYGATMSSTYNGRALIPEVMVDGDRFAVVRRRVEIAEQIGWDSVPDFIAAPKTPGASA